MLCAIRKSDQETMLAGNETKANGPFLCPECKEEVVLKKGGMKIHHFAHKPPVTCSYGLGETEEHRRCKMEIYAALLAHPLVTKAKLERDLKTVRPDVSAVIAGRYVAIEVQISTLPIETVIHRTEEYTRKGICILWLSPWTPKLDDDRYSPRPWEKWVHAAYFGRIYYWKSGLTVVPYRLDPYYLHVSESTFYSEEGEEQRHGGFDRRSARYRTPICGDSLDVVRDFEQKMREPWESKAFTIPRSNLFMDRKRFVPQSAGKIGPTGL